MRLNHWTFATESADVTLRRDFPAGPHHIAFNSDLPGRFAH